MLAAAIIAIGSAGTSAAVPAPPVITVPTNGSVLTHATITVEGTAQPGVTVEVSRSTGGTLTGIADASGAWRATGTFSSTTHTLVATAIGPGAERSQPSAAVTFRVDLIDPPAPVIYTPKQGGSTNVSNVTIGGSAEPGSTVRVSEGSVIATVVAVSDGTWSAVVPMSEGTHTIEARATDQAGRVGPPSTPVTFAVDGTAPAAPTIGSPAAGALIAEQVTFSGKAEPRATVELLRGGTGNVVVGTTAADGMGAWSITLTLPHGEHVYRARARDGASNVGPVSPERFFRVDADVPSVRITSPDDQIFLPGQRPLITGVASDGIGVRVVELQLYDLLGDALPPQAASCVDCPAPGVDWRATISAPSGRYLVKVYAVDRVGHRSQVDQTTFIKL